MLLFTVDTDSGELNYAGRAWRTPPKSLDEQNKPCSYKKPQTGNVWNKRPSLPARPLAAIRPMRGAGGRGKAAPEGPWR